MPSCLLVLIFIYRFSSFSLPFLCTDGTLQLASHSASSLSSPQIKAFHILLLFFWYNIRYFWALPYQEAKLRQRACTGSLMLFKSHKGHPPSLYFEERELVWIQKAFSAKNCHRIHSVQYHNPVCFMDVYDVLLIYLFSRTTHIDRHCKCASISQELNSNFCPSAWC